LKCQDLSGGISQEQVWTWRRRGAALTGGIDIGKVNGFH